MKLLGYTFIEGSLIGKLLKSRTKGMWRMENFSPKQRTGKEGCKQGDIIVVALVTHE